METQEFMYYDISWHLHNFLYYYFFRHDEMKISLICT